MYIAALIIVLIFAFFLFAVRGRVGNVDLAKLKGFDYAHRGLHGNGAAENSITAFARAKENCFGVELDVHLLKDGNLAVFHDSDLTRITGQKGNIEDLNITDLKNYYLENTGDTIPSFDEVLKLFDGAVPLIVELKPFKNNHNILCEKVSEKLEQYNGVYCIESFDPRCVYWFKKHKPQVLRGQLAENSLKRKLKINAIIRFLMTNNLLNFLTKPDFVAYRIEDRKVFSNKICQKLWKMQMVGWTIRNIEDHNAAKKENWLSIFEYFIP